MRQGDLSAIIGSSALILALTACQSDGTALRGLPDAATRADVTQLATAANASGYRILHSFGSGTDGAVPTASVTALGGVLYGTTAGGGTNASTQYQNGAGTFFEMRTDGSERVLYNFKGGLNAALPQNGLVAVDGALFGASDAGGRAKYGVAYKLTPSGEETIVYDFFWLNWPVYVSGTLTAMGGELFGENAIGGPYKAGGVVEINPSGTGKFIYNFGAGNCEDGDGCQPVGSLITLNGVLIGTTEGGGLTNTTSSGCKLNADGCGTVFTVTASGKEAVLYRFKGNRDGAAPLAGVVADPNGNLYGTTSDGGGGPCHNSAIYDDGCGTVFELVRSGSTYTERVLYRFEGGVDGADPTSGLTLVNGSVYGVTLYGGLHNANCSLGCGVLFKLAPSQSGYRFEVMHSFGASGDGEYPRAALSDVNGELYGTTSLGGAFQRSSCPTGCGTVFEIKP